MSVHSGYRESKETEPSVTVGHRERYQLWEALLPLPVDPPAVLHSLEEARDAAVWLGRPVRIYRTLRRGATVEYVETFSPQEAG